VSAFFKLVFIVVYVTIPLIKLSLK